MSRAERLALTALAIATLSPFVPMVIDHIDKPPTPPAMTDHGGCAAFHYLPTGDFVCDRMQYPAGDGPEYTAKLAVYRDQMKTWYDAHPDEVKQ